MVKRLLYALLALSGTVSAKPIVYEAHFGCFVDVKEAEPEITNAITKDCDGEPFVTPKVRAYLCDGGITYVVEYVCMTKEAYIDYVLGIHQ